MNASLIMFKMSDLIILSTDYQYKAIPLILLKLNNTVDGVAGHTYLKVNISEFSFKFKIFRLVKVLRGWLNEFAVG